MADEHFVIEKESQDEATRTRIRSLEREEMIREIARLLGSDTLTETVFPFFSSRLSIIQVASMWNTVLNIS